LTQIITRIRLVIRGNTWVYTENGVSATLHTTEVSGSSFDRLCHTCCFM